jgi:hypothetical protein
MYKELQRPLLTGHQLTDIQREGVALQSTAASLCPMGAGKQSLRQMPILQQDALKAALRSGHGRQRGADQFWADNIKLTHDVGVALKDGPLSHGGKNQRVVYKKVHKT